MVDRVNKVLRKLSVKERKQLLKILELVRTGRIESLDVKKLQGSEHLYRIRKGSFRIIFFMKSREDIRVIALERRSDTTYR